jgi:hypothetical protein
MKCQNLKNRVDLEHWCSDTDQETKPYWRIRKFYSLAPSRTVSAFRMSVGCSVALPLTCTISVCSLAFYTVKSACFTRSTRLNHGNHKYIRTSYIIDATSHDWEPCTVLYMFELVFFFEQTSRSRHFVISLLPLVLASIIKYNMVMSPATLGTKNNCAREGHQQFTRPDIPFIVAIFTTH